MMYYLKNKKLSKHAFGGTNLKPAGAVKLKKITALSAITACLLLPTHLLSGETRIYDGDTSMLANIGNYNNSFGLQNLDNFADNQIFVTTGDIGSVFGAFRDEAGAKL